MSAIHDDLLLEFQSNCMRLLTVPESASGRLLHSAVGVCGEAGELIDAIKKHFYYGAPLDRENVLEECGDILFYVSVVLGILGYSVDDAVIANMSKLSKRYPSGFSQQAAIERVDKKEG